MFRDQQVAFRLAREVCLRWQADNGAAALPVQQLFPKVAFAAKRFLAEKLDRKGDSQPCDVLLVGEYMQAAISSLLEAIKKGSSTAESEVAVVPQGAAGWGSTLFVDFHTTKPIYPVTRCHLNAMGRRYPEMGTERGVPPRQPLRREEPGEERSARLLHPLPQSRPTCSVRPGFSRGHGVRAERDCRGQRTGDGQRGCKGESGATLGGCREPARSTRRLALSLVTDPGRLGQILNAFTGASWSEGEFALS